MRKTIRTALAILIAAVVAAPAPAQPTARKAVATARYSLNTPLKTLLKDPRAKAVVRRHLPNLVNDTHLWMYDRKSLNEVAAYPGSSLSPEKLRKIRTELAQLR